MLVDEVSPADVPLDLLLLADPSEAKLRSYLALSKCFVANAHGSIVGVCVVKPLDQKAYELMNIAVAPSQQKSGIGTRLLEHVIWAIRETGAHRLEVGTGTFGYQLAFYQRQGFRAIGVERDFFLENYPEPIFDVAPGSRVFEPSPVQG